MKGPKHEEWSGQLSLFEDDSARQAPTGRDAAPGRAGAPRAGDAQHRMNG